MANDPQYAVFGDRACSPGLLPDSRKPFVCPIVVNVSRVNQRNEDIDV